MNFGVFLLCLLSFDLSESFSVEQQQPCCSRRCWHRPVMLLLRGKAPPSSLFDLEAIENFEFELDKQLEKDDEYFSLLKGEEGDVEDISDDDTDVEGSRQYEIPLELDGKRIDAAIAALEPDVSRSVVGRLLEEGHVSLAAGHDDSNGKRQIISRKSFKVEQGQVIVLEKIHKDTAAPKEIIAQDIPLDILFEDEHMIVLNKASNMVVHPAAGNWDGTVVNALAFYLTQKSPFGSGEFHNPGGKAAVASIIIHRNNNDDATEEAVFFRPGIVHRLDKGTTGILVVAKTGYALTKLSADFAARRVKKTYLAITVGNPGKRVVIDKPIERHPVHRQRMRVVPDHNTAGGGGGGSRYQKNNRGDSGDAPTRGRRALSLVDTIAFDGKLSLVRVRIETGRTHQIRVHLQDRHTPIYGDDVYGLSDWNRRLSSTHQIERPLLHAYRLELHHPVTGEPMEFEAPMPPDMRRLVQTIDPREIQHDDETTSQLIDDDDTSTTTNTEEDDWHL